MPATSGASGPTRRSHRLVLAERDDRAVILSIEGDEFRLFRDAGIAGGGIELGESGDWAIFQARACSRPPEPIKRTFIASLQCHKGMAGG